MTRNDGTDVSRLNSDRDDLQPAATLRRMYALAIAKTICHGPSNMLDEFVVEDAK